MLVFSAEKVGLSVHVAFDDRMFEVKDARIKSIVFNLCGPDSVSRIM